MSETDFLKLKKHDNVETNTEKFDIENYLNGNWDKINENAKEVNTDILNINSNNTELEKELKEIQDDFYQNSIRGQASGEYIHVEDSSNCRAKIGIGGNQEQETRSGKNLLELMEGTYSNNGITAVVKDGIITLNGTATAISFVGINLLKSIELTSDKTYHLSAFNEKTAGDGTNYCSLRINQDNIQVLFNTANVNGSITTNLKISYITIRTAQGITYNNFVVKPQLELGAGTSTWEQGGVSPSPDYKSDVQAVGSNVNLIEETFKGYNINANGAFEKLNGFDIQIVKVKANVKYTLNTNTNLLGYYNEKPTTSSITYDKSRTVLSNLTNVIIPSKTGYIAIRTSNTEKVKIVEGTEIGEYSKYGQGCVKVTKCNKNLYNKNKEIICNGVGVGANGELFSRSDQKLLIIPISKLETNIAISFTKTFSYNLRYAFSDTIVENTNSEIFNADYVENSTTTNIKVNKIIQNNKHNYLLLGFTNKDNYSDLQVEYKKEVSQYEEYQEQSYIMPVQSEMLEGDYFDFDNEEEVHIWNKLILSGSEDIVDLGVTINSYKIKTNLKAIVTDDTINYICNYFKAITVNERFIDKTFFINKDGDIAFSCSDIKTVENFKAWLKAQYDVGTPVTIYYKLATPTRLKFTDEQKAVAKELNNARTYKNVTNITTDSKAILSLDYAKDLETLLTSKESEV